MNYEFHQELSKKADKWEFESLRSKVHDLENENRNLQSELSYVKNKLNNHYSALEKLIQLLSEGDLSERTNELFELRQWI